MHRKTLTSALLKIFCATALLVGQWSMAAEPGDETQEQPVEEIVVVAEKSTSQLKHEIEAAKTLVYETYNELNTDDDYDIECRKESQIGSQVLRTYCHARIYWESRGPREEEEDTLAITRRASYQPTYDRTMQEKMRELALRHPTLLKAIVRREILKRELASRDD